MAEDDPKAGARDATRQRILDQASRLLSEDGPHALSMRKLAERVGASTIVLYTYFANKQDILDNLYREGFLRLQRDLEAVPAQARPMEQVMALGRAYRRSAVANATYYQIMFSQCVPGFTPSAQSLQASRQCLTVLSAAVQRCADAGQPLAHGVHDTTQVLWGTLHGLISLELFGHLGGLSAGEVRLEQAMQSLRAGIAGRAASPSAASAP
jgi:AcrR family transcriptional regulator